MLSCQGVHYCAQGSPAKLRLSAHLAATLLQVEKENPDLVTALKKHAKNNEIMLALANGIMICKNTTICWWVRASFGHWAVRLPVSKGGDGRGWEGQCWVWQGGEGRMEGGGTLAAKQGQGVIWSRLLVRRDPGTKGTESLDGHRESGGVRSREAGRRVRH